jgi:hypothetical protein
LRRAAPPQMIPSGGVEALINDMAAAAARANGHAGAAPGGHAGPPPEAGASALAAAGAGLQHQHPGSLAAVWD